METVLALIFYVLFFTVSATVLLVVALYSVWIYLFDDKEVEPEDRIFR